MNFPDNRFQVFLESTDGLHDRISVAHSVTHAQARDMQLYPAGTIVKNGRKWIYSYSLMDQCAKRI